MKMSLLWKFTYRINAISNNFIFHRFRKNNVRIHTGPLKPQEFFNSQNNPQK